MLNNHLKLGNIIALAGVIVFLTSCGGAPETTAWENPLNFYNENIAAYHEAALGTQSKEKSGNQSVYIDFSNGIKQAMQESSIKNVVKYFSGVLTGDEIDWFGLGDHKYSGVGPIKFEANRVFFDLVTTPDNYDDIYAPIEEALKQIVSKKNDAILITDFEEYSTDKTENVSPYALPYFTKWLNDGNSITFYYHEYTEKNKIEGKKNLYFVLFNYGEVNENSLLTKFKNAIRKRTGLEKLQKFDISLNPYSVSNDYGGEQENGLTIDADVEKSVIIESMPFYYNGFVGSKRPFEAFEFSDDLNAIKQNLFENGRFAKNLFLDASNNSSFILKNVKVEVSDVTDDYVNYIRSTEAKANVPTIVKDQGNNDVWDEANMNEIMTECYEKNTKDLKKEYKYNHTPGSKISEIFDYDVTIFSDRLKNSPNEVELITTFHKNFTRQFSNNDPIIVRIDYVIESTQENYSSQIDAFKWNSIIKINSVNDCLSESIRNTLQAVKPKKILYSYYLKLEPSK